MTSAPVSSAPRLIDGASPPCVLHYETRERLLNHTLSTANAVAYLESADYERAGWLRGVPYSLMEMRGLFDGDSSFPIDEHHDALCDKYEALCTGDGFRWSPDLPELRFT